LKPNNLFFEILEGYAANQAAENTVSSRNRVEIKKSALSGKGTKTKKTEFILKYFLFWQPTFFL